MIIRPVKAESFHAERRTDMTKLIVAFNYFASAPKNCTSILLKTTTVCYVQSFGKRLGMRCVFLHTLTLKNVFVCVRERESKRCGLPSATSL